MELELGLKLTKVADEFASTDLLIAKDRAGPLFLAQQTETMFILTAHLKGYRRKNIKIEINEDGSRITISGEKAVQETLMVGWEVVKKGVEMRGFRKAFKIPQGVVLDRVKARFNEDESTLMIRMPKLAKGVVGIGIEELKEEEIPSGPGEQLKVLENGEISEQENFRDDEAQEAQVQEIQEEVRPSDSKPVEKQEGSAHEGTSNRNFQAENERKSKANENEEVGQEIKEKEKPEFERDLPKETAREEDDTREAESPRTRSKICTPIIAGSALFVSLIVLVFHLIRSKNETSKKRN